MGSLPRPARVYVLAVIASGVLFTLLVPPQLDGAKAWHLLFFLGMTVVAELNPVDLPEYGVVSVAFAFHGAAYLLFAPGAAALMAAVASAAADARVKQPLFKMAFNSSQYYICIALAGLTHRTVSLWLAGFGTAGHVRLLLTWVAFTVSVLVYYVLNVTLVCFAFALSQGRSATGIWFRHFRGYLMQYGALAALGLLVARVFVEEWLATALLVLPVLIVYRGLKNYTELQVETRQALETLVDVIDRRDSYTNQHSQRVAEHAARTARHLRLDEDSVEIITMAARVHDLGKVGVTDDLLLKPGALDTRGWWVMQQHPRSGADITARLRLYRRGSPLIRGHHENYDGSGYPDGLAGEDIPLGARIIRVADAYDAMVTDRPYRKGRPAAEALAVLQENAETEFDPKVVAAFLEWNRQDGLEIEQPQAAATGERAEC
ncbi:MAG: HD domain-containing phosphohydrolase [Bacillota bacterium]